nr:MAG TPA: Major capsid protein [Caudoviricetes sp.]
MAEIENKETEVVEQNTNTTNTDVKENNDKETNKEHDDNKVNVDKVKSDTISNLLKTLDVEDEESLKGIVSKAKEAEEANKTELQKKTDTLTQTTKELANEREARIIAEAKLSAIQLGAKPELVEDLVIVAKSKVTKDKGINAVIAEIKDSSSGKVYFSDGTEEEEHKKKTVTRARVTKKSEKETKEKDTENNGKEDNKGSMAERLLSRRKEQKKHYFS